MRGLQRVERVQVIRRGATPCLAASVQCSQERGHAGMSDCASSRALAHRIDVLMNTRGIVRTALGYSRDQAVNDLVESESNARGAKARVVMLALFHFADALHGGNEPRSIGRR